jgi:hypothetical protein
MKGLKKGRAAKDGEDEEAAGSGSDYMEEDVMMSGGEDESGSE